MKKIISVIIFGLLCCTSSFADIKRKVLETSNDKAWNINGKFFKPECFENNLMEWMSSDNYEEYYTKYLGKKTEDSFADKEFRRFVSNIGLYLGKEIPLNHTLNTSWDSKISLTLNLKDCLISNPEVSVQIKDDDAENYISYEISKNYDLNQAKILAPNLNEKFVSIKEIRAKYDGTYSAPVDNTLVTYGVINKDGKFLMVPLKQ
jgi:hypothetical protein